jgi:primosomal protein N'
MLLLRCPHCKNIMKYESSAFGLQNKRKRCVYCGKSYKVGNSIIKKL